MRALDPDTRLIGCTQAFGASGGSFAMSGTEAPEGVPPEVASAHREALSWLEQQHGQELGLREVVPMLHSALLAVLGEQRAMQVTLQALQNTEAGMKQDMTGAKAAPAGARLTVLEQSVEALKAEKVEFEYQHSEEQIHWHDDIERLERRLERLEAPSRPVVASADDASAGPEGSTLAAVELKLAATEVRLTNLIRELENGVDMKAEQLQGLERRLIELQPASHRAPVSSADLRPVDGESMSDLDSKLAELQKDLVARISDTAAQSISQMQHAISTVDTEVRTAVLTEFSGAMREMGTLTEELGQRIDASTKLAEAACADARTAQASVDASSQARECWAEELQQWTERSMQELRAQQL